MGASQCALLFSITDCTMCPRVSSPSLNKETHTALSAMSLSSNHANLDDSGSCIAERLALKRYACMTSHGTFTNLVESPPNDSSVGALCALLDPATDIAKRYVCSDDKYLSTTCESGIVSGSSSKV